MEYRRALLRVSGEIGQKDLEKLKFACRDAIPESQRERIHSPRDLFTALEEKGLLGSDNLDYISRQFINIGRPQLRSCFVAFGLYVPPPDQYQTSPTSSNGDTISPNERFTNFLLTLSERLNSEEIDKLAFAWCKNYLHITPDHIHSAYQLFTLMTQRLAITPNNLDILYVELNEMGRQDLCRIVDEYYSVTHKLYHNGPPSIIPSPAPSTPYDVFTGYLNKPIFPPEEFYPVSTPPVNVPPRPNNLQFSTSPQDSINAVSHSTNDTPPSSENSSMTKPSRDNIPNLHQQQHSWSDVLDHNTGSQRSLSITSGSNDGSPGFSGNINTPNEGEILQKEKELHGLKEQMLSRQQPSQSEIANYHLEIQRLQDALRQKNQEIQQIVDNSTLSLSNLKIECYPMNQDPHGYCIIFNNYTFYQVEEEYEQLTDRGGADMDQKTLVSTFEFLRYKVESYENLTSEQMIDKMKEVSSRDHTAFDSFVCCILTHGEEGKVFGSDSLPVNIQDLTGLVKGTFCRSLVNKPKLFFVQACRGDREEKGIPIEKDGNFSLPVEVDYLFGYATPTGKAAYRSRRHGSWFISELCDVFTKSAHEMGLSNMMKKVNSNVSDAYTKEGYKQCTEVVDRLRKEVKFLPTYSH